MEDAGHEVRNGAGLSACVSRPPSQGQGLPGDCRPFQENRYFGGPCLPVTGATGSGLSGSPEALRQSGELLGPEPTAAWKSGSHRVLRENKDQFASFLKQFLLNGTSALGPEDLGAWGLSLLWLGKV